MKAKTGLLPGQKPVFGAFGAHYLCRYYRIEPGLSLETATVLPTAELLRARIESIISSLDDLLDRSLTPRLQAPL